MPGFITDDRAELLQRFVVTAQQMSHIESRVFAAGMPVAALMEKVAGLITQRVVALYPDRGACVGVLVGPGHNGGDALVVARELHLKGYSVQIFCPFAKLKELTETHARYVKSLGIPFSDRLDSLRDCSLLIDGLFGFGLTRPLEGEIAQSISAINDWGKPIISIDLPSGLHTNTGEALGTAVRAAHTLCLGLWKRAFLQDQSLEYSGEVELIDFDLPLADIQAVLGEPVAQRITAAMARQGLPLPRPATSHKYLAGHTLLICGSRQYVGAALLAGLAARASGVGMLSIAVPESNKHLVSGQIPDALVIGCRETESGAIANLPEDLDLGKYGAIACGPGLSSDALQVVKQVLDAPVPLILDADGLNMLVQLGTKTTLQTRTAPTVLTPHLGEFRRLFPEIVEEMSDAASGMLRDRIAATQKAAQESGAIVLLKGARTVIASDSGSRVWINPESTPALARGGSGDVLTGLMAGLLAQNMVRSVPVEQTVQTAAWWHAQAGKLGAQARTELGVDASTLVQYLIPAVRLMLSFK